MRPLITISLCLFLFGFSSCARIPHLTDVTILFEPALVINDGVLLPVDVLALDSRQSTAALEVGPENWFGEDIRARLTGEELIRLAIRGGEPKSITVGANQDVDKIIIFADFENNSARAGQQIVIIPGKFSFLPNYKVRINKDSMELDR